MRSNEAAALADVPGLQGSLLGSRGSVTEANGVYDPTKELLELKEANAASDRSQNAQLTTICSVHSEMVCGTLG